MRHSCQWQQLFFLAGLFQATPHHTWSTTAAFGAELLLISVWCKQASSQRRSGLVGTSQDSRWGLTHPSSSPEIKWFWPSHFARLTSLELIHKLQLTVMLHHPTYLPWGLQSPQGRNPLPLYSAAGSDLGRTPQLLLWHKASLKLRTHTGGSSLSTGDRQHYNGTAERG